MTEFAIVEPFDCDDPAFCYGVEWEQFRQKLVATDGPFTLQIHAENAERLTKMCERHNRFCEVLPPPLVDGFPADHFKDWQTIQVGGSKQ